MKVVVTRWRSIRSSASAASNFSWSTTVAPNRECSAVKNETALW